MRLDAVRIPRFLTQKKAFAACVVFSLGVGISATAGVFAVVDSVLRGPLPIPNADRIEVLYLGGRPNPVDRLWNVSPDIVRAVAGSGSPVEDVAMYRYMSISLRDGERALSTSGAEVSPNFARMLGARMHIGRPLSPTVSDDVREVMLAYRTWRADFGSDSSVVGRTITINEAPHTVVGVAAREWTLPNRWINMWVTNGAMLAANARPRNVSALVLRRADVEAGQARAMIATVATGAMVVKVRPRDRIETMPLRERLTLDLAGGLLVLSLIAAFVAFITAVNFAGLVLARGIRRRGEIGVRAALGASLWRLVREIVGESLMLCALGGLLAAILSPSIVAVLRASFAESLPAWLEITLSWRIVAASVALSMLIGVVFGLGPALDLARPALGTFLRSTGSGVSGTAGAARARAGLVSVQVALATGFLVLLGAVMGRAMVLTRPEPGIDFEPLILGYVYSDTSSMKGLANLLANVEQTPGVSGAALTYTRYLDPNAVTFEGGEGASLPSVWWSQTTESFHYLTRPTLVAGRFPEPEELRSRAPVAVVTRVLARRAFDDQAVGRTIRIGKHRITVIGVVESFEKSAFAYEPSATIFTPVLEPPTRLSETQLWARAASPAQVQGLLRDLRAREARRQLGSRVSLRSLDVSMRNELQSLRAVARLVFGIFAVALGLAALGIYGLVSYSAGMRSRELAIREALGATRTRVAALLLQSAALQTLIGVVAGALLATLGAAYLRDHDFKLTLAVGSTSAALIVLALTVLASSVGPLRATWRRDLSQVLRD